VTLRVLVAWQTPDEASCHRHIAGRAAR
jgi:hypothetical protein